MTAWACTLSFRGHRIDDSADFYVKFLGPQDSSAIIVQTFTQVSKAAGVIGDGQVDIYAKFPRPRE